MLRQATDELAKGIPLNGCTIRTRQTTKGRFLEEQNIQINMESQSDDRYLICAKVFYGRPPAYAPWVELFNIEERIVCNGQTTEYFDSQVENFILQHFIASLEPGARIFVEYYNDHETRKQLGMGYPVVLTRLGHKMFHHGCTWFKDWYFPEGYLEGNQKLQGEKPLHAHARERHIRMAHAEVMAFVEKLKTQDVHDDYSRSALARVASVMTELCP